MTLGPIEVRPDPPWKRPLDLLLATLGLIVLAPVLVAITAVILRADGWPAFYLGTRVGRGGRDFRLYKFRSMVRDADRIGGASTPEDDERLLPIGRTLRRYKLDELPQLINVLRGEMSIVGPRPQVRWAVERYSGEEWELLSVRPGITDPASLAFADESRILAGAADPDAEYYRMIHPEKVRLSLQHLRKMSLLGDVSVIVRTVLAIAGVGRGTSEI